MPRLVTIMSLSLDGFVAGPNDDVSGVFDWYFTSGDVEVRTDGADPRTFRVSAPSAAHLGAVTGCLGAMLTGRRTFQVAEGWGGRGRGPVSPRGKPRTV